MMPVNATQCRYTLAAAAVLLHHAAGRNPDSVSAQPRST